MGRTKIEWATAVWNPVTGCTPVSAGCRNCYAERFARRLAGRCGYPKDEPFRVTLHPERLEEPLRWMKPRRVFVCSMGDLFHEDVPTEFILKVFEIMAIANEHTFLVLTKRSGRMKKLLAYDTKCESAGHHRLMMTMPLPNTWLGVTAENQRAADERIPILLQIPAVVHWVSCEPLLGHVDLSNWLEPTWACPECGDMAGYIGELCSCKGSIYLEQPRLRWVVAGGETGPRARPCHPDWVRSLRDQCQTAGVSFFFKRWGEWAEIGAAELPFLRRSTPGVFLNLSGEWRFPGDRAFEEESGTVAVARLGRKLTGRLLDGRTWDEFPETKRKGLI